MIDWQQVTLNLRHHYKPLDAICRDYGWDRNVLGNLSRNMVVQPKFNVGYELLKLHKAYCPNKHELLNIKGNLI